MWKETPLIYNTVKANQKPDAQQSHTSGAEKKN